MCNVSVLCFQRLYEFCLLCFVQYVDFYRASYRSWNQCAIVRNYSWAMLMFSRGFPLVKVWENSRLINSLTNAIAANTKGRGTFSMLLVRIRAAPPPPLKSTLSSVVNLVAAHLGGIHNG